MYHYCRLLITGLLCSATVLADDLLPEDPIATPVSDIGAEQLMKGHIIAPTEQYKGVVKVEVDSLMQNYALPWQSGGYVRGLGTAFLIGKKLFMTNAHVVSNAERIYISQYGDSRKIPAKVKYVAHDSDLALLEVEDFKLFEGLPYLEFSKELPRLEDEVRTIGYPVGGNRLSVTRGVVSRIDFIPYSHPRMLSHLAIQIDAAINPGNSGGPVLMGNKVIGVAFQGLNNANSTGYVIPTSVIERFLEDIKDGRYDSYVDLGAALMPIVNPTMRKALKLPDDEKGVLVGQVSKGGSCDGLLQVGDVVLSIDGYDVDSSGMIDLNGQNVSMNELFERSFDGDSLVMNILRNGNPKKVEIVLKPSRAAGLMVEEYDKLPRYVVYGGLLFQPLQRNVLVAHKIPGAEIALEYQDFRDNGGLLEKDDIVMITDTLDDEVNARLPGLGDNRIVQKVNGVTVKGLSHLNDLLYGDAASDDPFVVIEVKGEDRPFVLERKAADEANKRIAHEYNIAHSSRLSDSKQ